MRTILFLALLWLLSQSSYGQTVVYYYPPVRVQTVRPTTTFYQYPQRQQVVPSVPVPPEMPVQAHRPNRQRWHYSPNDAYADNDSNIVFVRNVQLGMINFFGGERARDEEDVGVFSRIRRLRR